MVAKPGQYQFSMNAGELAPELHGNTGLKQYYAGLKAARRIEPIPQGGFALSPGSRSRGYLRRPLSVVNTLAGTTTGAISTAIVAIYWATGGYVISGVDLNAIASSIEFGAFLLQCEAQDVGGTWHPLGGPITMSINARNHRLCFAPGVSITSIALRLRFVNTPFAPVAVTIASVYLLQELGYGLPAHRKLNFSRSRSETYAGFMSQGHVDFWKNGVYAGCVVSPYGEGELGDVKAEQRQETMLLFHQNYVPFRILRHGADYQWSLSGAPFTNIPDVDYGLVYSTIAEKWMVGTQNASDPNGAIFTINIDGEETDGITVNSADLSVVTLAIKNAVEALAGVDAGVTVTLEAYSGSFPNTYEWSILFNGGRNPGANFAISGRVAKGDMIAFKSWRLIPGKPGGEPVFSSQRGYPACGIFYQDRLALGGFRSQIDAFAMSRTGEYFDLDTDVQNAAGALVIKLDTEGDEGIVSFARSAHLVLFTSTAHYYVSDRAISRTNPPNIVRSEKQGILKNVPPIDQEGSLLFFNRDGTILLAATYDDVGQRYKSEPISLLSSHLIRNVVDAALQPASLATDAEKLHIVRADGVLIQAHLIRSQEVASFTRWETDGAVRSVAVDANGLVYLTVERIIDGAARIVVETLDGTTFFDGAVSAVLETPAVTVAGLRVHEGRTVWALADGYVEGPFVVEDGLIVLPFNATNVTVGRWTAPLAETLPPVREVAQRTVLKRPMRIHTVKLDVIDATSLAIGANGLAARNVPLVRAGDPIDAPTPARTGQITATGLAGFSDESGITITQLRPGWLQVRDITVEARL